MSFEIAYSKLTPFPLPHPLSQENLRNVNATPRLCASFANRRIVTLGTAYRRERMEAADMLKTANAAALAGTSRVTINSWIKSSRCIGVSYLQRGFKMPKWQFEPVVFDAIQPIARCFNSTNGWQLLTFFETPSQSLDDLAPRAALEQGVPREHILALALALATAEAH